MKKKLILLVLLSLLLSLNAFAASGDTIVYITNSGTKYHQYGCGYLSQSCNEITLENAVARGYEPCSRCYPPELDYSMPVENTPAPTPTPAPTSKPSSYSNNYSETRTSSVADRFKEKAAAEAAQTAAEIRSKWIIGILACGVGLIGGLVIMNLKRISDTNSLRKEIILKETEISRLERDAKIRKIEVEAEFKQREWNAKKEAYFDCYGNRPSIRFVSKPSSEWIGPDRLPCSSGDGQWGERFTFYITGSGRSFHKTRGCSEANQEINAYNVKYRDLNPCKRCCPALPCLSWYEDYLRIENTRRKYGIPYVHYQIDLPITDEQE